MKHFILWSVLFLGAVLIYIIFDKTTVLTIFDKSESPLYVDIVIIITLSYTVVGRCIALLKKIR